MQDFEYSPIEVDYLCNIGKKYSFLYYSTPKVACTTIITTLQILEGSEKKDINNVHNKSKSNLFGLNDSGLSYDEVFHDTKLYKFCFVRNPYTRVLSAYLDKIVERRDPNWITIYQNLGFKPWKNYSFLEFLIASDRLKSHYVDMHWRPLSYILRTDKIAYDYIGKFENFDSDFRTILNNLGVPEAPIHTMDLHATKANSSFDKYYSSKELDMVNFIYKDDFEQFDYAPVV